MKKITNTMNLQINKFVKSYMGHQVNIIDISSNKRILILRGKNGSGKSTALKAIHNMISFKGEIICNGTISYMNEVIHFPKDSKVSEVINAFNCIDKNSIETLVLLVDQFDLKHKIQDNISSLSKGMIMKLQLLCTFLVDKDIYVLDEPFSGLDKVSIDKLRDFIQTSKKRFIIASHIDVSFQRECDVIIL